MSGDGVDYERLYDRLAPVYGFLWERIGPWLRYTRRALPLLEGTTRVLELGPGPGVLHREIAEGRPLTVGLDISQRMLQRAQERLRRANVQADLIRGDAVRLPMADASVDAVVATFVLSAIPDGVGALREAGRVLCPGGLVVLVDAGYPSDGNLGGRFLAWLWTLFGDVLRDEAELMRQAGLEVVEREEFGAFRGIRLVVGRKPLNTH